MCYVFLLAGIKRRPGCLLAETARLVDMDITI